MRLVGAIMNRTMADIESTCDLDGGEHDIDYSRIDRGHGSFTWAPCRKCRRKVESCGWKKAVDYVPGPGVMGHERKRMEDRARDVAIREKRIRRAEVSVRDQVPNDY